jgi:hypothetical protein
MREPVPPLSWYCRCGSCGTAPRSPGSTSCSASCSRSAAWWWRTTQVGGSSWVAALRSAALHVIAQLGEVPHFLCTLLYSFLRSLPSLLSPIHTAVNQALLCTALGLPPPFFRRFAQTNGAFTVLDFKYSGPEGSQRVPVQPTVQVERMNQVRKQHSRKLAAFAAGCGKGGRVAKRAYKYSLACIASAMHQHTTITTTTTTNAAAVTTTCLAVSKPPLEPQQNGQVDPQAAGADLRGSSIAGGAGAELCVQLGLLCAAGSLIRGMPSFTAAMLANACGTRPGCLVHLCSQTPDQSLVPSRSKRRC